MLDANDFIACLARHGHAFFTGVPCSLLTPLINRLEALTDGDYVPATSEGEAVAIAAGAWLAGRPATVFSQNSGLGNMTNPITSLNYPFKIPFLLLLTWRGGPAGADEPQHELMGRITRDQLDLIEVGSRLLLTDPDRTDECLDVALAAMRENSLPFALIVPDKAFLPAAPPVARVRSCPTGKVERFSSSGPRPKRIAVLERMLEVLPDEAAVIATTGKCARELYTLEDRPQHLYMVGAMGSASAVGLGIALHAARPVVVLDGDGAALMRLGTFATIGAQAPTQLIHVLLDNGVHDSTGGQRTVSSSIDFAAIAAACGYRSAVTCDDLATFARCLSEAIATDGPHLVHVRIEPGSIEPLARPRIAPHEVAARFSAFLSAGSTSS